MITIRDLTFSYSDSPTPALSHVDLDVAEGEWLALIGHNGSGKSTLARMLNGLLLPGSGQVLVDEMDTADPELIYKIRERVAFVFQNPDNQFIATSVEDDIAFGLENLGLPREEITRRVENALADLHLTELRDKAPHQLSGGEKQRVALAGALAMSSRYLVLDEPTSMLDPALRSSVLLSLADIRKKHDLSLIYVTNIMEEALLAQRIAVLEAGRIIRTGTPYEIFCDKDFVREHELVLPQIRQIAAMLAEDGYSAFDGVLTEDEFVEKLLCPR